MSVDKRLVSFKGRTFSSKNGNSKNGVSQAVVLFLKDAKTEAFRSKKKRAVYGSCSWRLWAVLSALPWSRSLSADCVPGEDNASCFGDSIFVHLHNLIFIKVYSNG